jgi:hypothetical protein
MEFVNSRARRMGPGRALLPFAVQYRFLIVHHSCCVELVVCASQQCPNLQIGIRIVMTCYLSSPFGLTFLLLSQSICLQAGAMEPHLSSRAI